MSSTSSLSERRYVSQLVPHSSAVVTCLIVGASMITSVTLGYDGSMMNGLNIIPQYTDYFALNTTTLSLNTASVWLGGCIAPVFSSELCDRFGRKRGMFWAAIITLLGVLLQTASQNVAMFVISRVIIGIGTGVSSIAAPVYVSETAPVKWRAFALGIFYDFWYVGGLIAAGITYGTAQMAGTWAWRLPSIFQGLPSFLCIIILPFIPESPRWLIYNDRPEDALEVLAVCHGYGNVKDKVVLTEFKEIFDTINFEKSSNQKTNWLAAFKGPGNRKRLMLTLSVAVFSMCSGNNIISYYLSLMLDGAGITSSNSQLAVNVVLSAFCLIAALLGTSFAESAGRRFLAISSTAGLTLFIFIIGALTKIYGSSDNQSGIYGTVASIFLFQGAYSFGWTPLTVMYPPEVLNYSIRASGLAIYTLAVNAFGLAITFGFPYALNAIGWKTYMINGAWDVLELLFVIFLWVETKGRTLEEIDVLMEEQMHTDAPKLAEVITGQVVVDGASMLEVVEQQVMFSKKE